MPSTVWSETPLGFVEQPWLATTPLSLDPLPEAVQSSLRSMATGSGQSEADIVMQIALFFVENEDERSEGTLLDAVVFYTENELL